MILSFFKIYKTRIITFDAKSLLRSRNMCLHARHHTLYFKNPALMKTAIRFFLFFTHKFKPFTPFLHCV